MANEREVERIWISLSHTENSAMATIVLEAHDKWHGQPVDGAAVVGNVGGAFAPRSVGVSRPIGAQRPLPHWPACFTWRWPLFSVTT